MKSIFTIAAMLGAQLSLAMNVGDTVSFPREAFTCRTTVHPGYYLPEVLNTLWINYKEEPTEDSFAASVRTCNGFESRLPEGELIELTVKAVQESKWGRLAVLEMGDITFYTPILPDLVGEKITLDPNN